MALALFDDAVDSGEAQSRSFAGRFRGEEGLEDLAENVLAHAATVIGNGRQNEGAWSNLAVRGCILGVQVARLRFDDQLAAVWHRIAGVDGKVHQNLLTLTRIGQDAPDFIGKVGDELDVLSDEDAQ